MSRRKPRGGLTAALTDAETRDILLWFGWGCILEYPTAPRDYLREALKPANRAEFLKMPRPKRKAILRFVIEEHARRRYRSGRRHGRCALSRRGGCSMKIDWQKDQCSWVARIGDVTLSAVPDRTSHFGTKAARGTKWRACVSHWDAPTRTVSRFGRDVYMQLCSTAKDATKLAEQVYRDENRDRTGRQLRSFEPCRVDQGRGGYDSRGSGLKVLKLSVDKSRNAI